MSESFKKGFPEFENSPKTLPELLSSGELPEEKYLPWASETFKLPLLTNDFFNLAKNFNLLLDNSYYKDWSDSFFPVQEWNGILYIACLEPRTIELKKKHCLVLGSYKAMKTLWAKMEQPLEASIVMTSEELEASIRRTQEKTALIDLEPHAEKTNLDALNWGDLKLESVDETGTETETKTTQSAPTPKPAEKATPAANLSAEAPKKLIDDSLSKSGFAINPRFTATNYKIPKNLDAPEREITNVATVPGAGLKSDVTFTTTKTIMPFPERTSQFTFTRTIYSSQVILEAEPKIQNNVDPQHALLSAFRILQDYYKKVMWVVRDQKGFAFPIACNSEWEFSEEAWNEPMNFKNTNPFRTAKLTQKPYHGPIYKNAATEKFFKLWNNGNTPDYFTVVPINMFGKVFGYLVGCEKGPHFHPVHSLEMMEVASKDLLETFIKIQKTMNNKAA